MSKKMEENIKRSGENEIIRKIKERKKISRKIEMEFILLEEKKIFWMKKKTINKRKRTNWKMKKNHFHDNKKIQ